jgi:hypothetical protein
MPPLLFLALLGSKRSGDGEGAYDPCREREVLEEEGRLVVLNSSAMSTSRDEDSLLCAIGEGGRS